MLQEGKSGDCRSADGQIDESYDEENVFEHKWITLREDRSCQGRCHITLFLSLAFADNTFEALLQLRDLTCLRAPPPRSRLALHIKSSAKTTAYTGV